MTNSEQTFSILDELDQRFRIWPTEAKPSSAPNAKAIFESSEMEMIVALTKDDSRGSLAFDMGDLVLRLRKQGFSLHQISQQLAEQGVKRGKATLGQYAQVSAAFPNRESRSGLSWYLCFKALQKSQLMSDNSLSPEQIARQSKGDGVSARMLT